MFVFIFSIHFCSFSSGRWHLSFSHRRYEIFLFSSNEIRLCSSFSVIHVSLNIESDFEKDTTLLFFFSLLLSPAMNMLIIFMKYICLRSWAQCDRESSDFSSTFYSTVVSIYYGLRAVELGDQGLWAVITFYIGEFLIFVFEVYLIRSKRNKEKNSVSMRNTRGKKMHFSYDFLLLVLIYKENSNDNICGIRFMHEENKQTPHYGDPLNMDGLLCPWGKKVLTLSINSARFLRTPRLYAQFVWPPQNPY